MTQTTVLPTVDEHGRNVRMSTPNAQAFIAQQVERFAEHNVRNATRRQRRRIKALDVVHTDRKVHAEMCIMVANHAHGAPPAGHSGRMRVVNMLTGEISIQRAPKRHAEEAEEVQA